MSKKYILAIFTNGPSDGQNLKIESLKIKKYFKSIYISEEIGYSKPNYEAFSFILKRENRKKEEVIMIGDSVEFDIKGAYNFGIKSILVDREKTKLWSGLVVSSLKDIDNFL